MDVLVYNLYHNLKLIDQFRRKFKIVLRTVLLEKFREYFEPR